MSNSQPSAEEALARLKDGNLRFVQGSPNRVQLGWHAGLAAGQQPFAVILACSDSRSPAELVFDQGLGDLFVIRIAGHVIAPSGVGSVEFAVEQFGTPLVVVMGHTKCGAVTAALAALKEGDNPESRNLRSITDRIIPHIRSLVSLSQKQEIDRDLLLREAVRANIWASVDQLRHGSQILEQKVNSGKVTVVGAEYELESGRVEFFDFSKR